MRDSLIACFIPDDIYSQSCLFCDNIKIADILLSQLSFYVFCIGIIPFSH